MFLKSIQYLPLGNDATYCLVKAHFYFKILCTTYTMHINAPVICIPGAGDSVDLAELKCQALTSDVSRQCRGFAEVLISRQYTVTLIKIRF